MNPQEEAARRLDHALGIAADVLHLAEAIPPAAKALASTAGQVTKVLLTNPVMEAAHAADRIADARANCLMKHPGENIPCTTAAIAGEVTRVGTHALAATLMRTSAAALAKAPELAVPGVATSLQIFNQADAVAQRTTEAVADFLLRHQRQLSTISSSLAPLSLPPGTLVQLPPPPAMPFQLPPLVPPVPPQMAIPQVPFQFKLQVDPAIQQAAMQPSTKFTPLRLGQ